MSIRMELEELDSAVSALRAQLKQTLAKCKGPKWIFTRANINRAESLMNAAGGHIREAHEHVPTELDVDD